MFFSLECLIYHAMLQINSEAIHFQLNESLPLKVSLRPHSSPEPRQDFDAVCRVEVVKEPDATVRSMLEGLSRDELPDDYDLSELPRSFTHDEKGERRKLHPQLVFMPKPFRDFHDEIFPPMKEGASRVLELLQWRFNRHGANLHDLPSGFKFSFDTQTWYAMPSRIDPTKARMVDSFHLMEFGEAEGRELKEALDGGSAEPLGHVLLREAWDLRLRSVRSALLIGFTAAEVGVKRHIVRMMPNTKNFVMRVPSPPIKYLLDYIDDIPTSAQHIGKGKLIPATIRRAMNEMAELRNKITHTGEHDPDGEHLTLDFLDAKLTAVRDLLWLLDYYAGHLWASMYVSSERMTELLESKGAKRGT
jgi:hypothetical protein